MNQSILIYLALISLFAPILGFVVTLLLGKKIKKIYLFEIFIISVVLISAGLTAFFKLSYFLDEKIVSEFTWINLGNVLFFNNLTVELGIALDNIAVIMLLVVAIISCLVHYYSIEYMRGDVRYNRYFAYLGIFTFAMNGIVLTHNLLMMYIFWELVGLSSYLLIGHWYEKKSASDAAKKAFIVNRIGDIGMFLGILMVFLTYNTFSFDKIFASISQGVLPFNSEFWLTITGILLFCGAVGKSAQFPLHVWLPDAMEGPTPVSALIHAATMVAAGVYLIVRIFVMLSGDALLVIASIGAISAFIPATIALTQTDIKKVLAYSTISQLGYMVMALGVGAYAYAFFHLIAHAFFKAGLFLGSGSVIHSMQGEQDITKMGGLRKKMPITYITFLIYSLAISGIPLTSGFLSKDGILASAYAFGSLTGNSIFVITGFLVAALTAFYMFRIIILTFHGSPKDKHLYEHSHESPKLMTVPLIILAICSFFFLFTYNPFSAESGWLLSKWIYTPTSVVPENVRYPFMISQAGINTINEQITHSEQYAEAMHHAHIPAMLISLLVAGLGILFAYLFYQWKKLDIDKFANSILPLYKFSLNKWYFDEFYNKVFVGATLSFSKIAATFDIVVIDGIVNGTGWLTKLVSRISGLFDTYVVDGLVNFMAYLSGLLGLMFRKLQSGKVQAYIVLVLFSIIILFFLFI